MQKWFLRGILLVFILIGCSKLFKFPVGPKMILEGTVRNIVDFGAFVDIGVHQDGLVHKSQLANKFVKHPLDIVNVGEIVNVKVLDVDIKRNRRYRRTKNLRVLS